MDTKEEREWGRVSSDFTFGKKRSVLYTQIKQMQ